MRGNCHETTYLGRTGLAASRCSGVRAEHTGDQERRVGAAAGLMAGSGGLAIPGIGPAVAAGWLASTLAVVATGAVAGQAVIGGGPGDGVMDGPGGGSIGGTSSGRDGGGSGGVISGPGRGGSSTGGWGGFAIKALRLVTD